MYKKILFSFLMLLCLSAKSQVLNWKTDISDAIEASNEQKKPMLILFTDDSADRALEVQILKTPDFALWSRNNVILVKLDLSDNHSNGNSERNLSLRKAFGVQDLPEICFSNVEIRKTKISYLLLGKIGFKSGGVKSWIADSDKILKGKVEEEE